MTDRLVMVESSSFPFGVINRVTGNWRGFMPSLGICIEPPLASTAVPNTATLRFTPVDRVTADTYACFFRNVTHDPTATRLEASTTIPEMLERGEVSLAVLRALVSAVGPGCNPEDTFTLVDNW